MKKIIPKSSRCQDCEFCYVHKDTQTKKKRGTLLYYGFRYCFFGKRIRKFTNRDPKIVLPKWCERQLRPPVLRIYEFRDAAYRNLHYMLGGDLVSESRYKLCCEERRHITLRELLEERRPKVNDRFLATDEVIEFDDGIRPIFFLKTVKELKLIDFNKTLTAEYKEIS